jgi:hypothetical protein
MTLPAEHESKWTTGPWYVGEPNDKSEHSIGIHGADWVLAEMCDDATDQDQDANAHLIAAAPDLYEALSS